MNPSVHLLEEATWIAAPYCGNPHTAAPVPHLRRSFRVAERPVSAILRITALGLYECEINGQKVGTYELTPGWTDYHQRVCFQTYDVTGLIGEGENVIGALLGDGWYCGAVAWADRQNYGDRPALLAVLEVTYEGERKEQVFTDKAWTCCAGPIFSSDLLHGESYDARHQLKGWSARGFDENDWQPVEVVTPSPLPALIDSHAALVKRYETLRPVKVEKLPWPLGWRFDFGQNLAGRLRIRLKAPRGTTLTISHAEMAHADGSLYTENLRKARATDSYTCSGEGVEQWEPKFTYHGFRYAEVVGGFRIDNAEPEWLEAEAVVLHSGMEQTGEFSCSCPLLNRLFENIIWSQRGNFVSVPTDCPQRSERLGWTGDAQVFVRTAAFNFDVEAFFRKWFQDLRDAQKPNGGVPGYAPNPGLSKLDDGGPGWSDATIICPWEIYRHYGDVTVLAEHYEAMQRYMEYIASERSIGHIRSHPDIDPWGYGDWLALDGHTNNRGATPQDYIGTAFYAYDALLMMKIAEVLGRSDDAARYHALREEIVAAFQRRFLTEEGLLVSGTQTAYALALCFDLLPKPKRAQAVQHLAHEVRKRGNHLATGFIGTPFLLNALSLNGELELAYELLQQESYPSWLFPVKNGATTIWERWDGWTPERGFQDKTMNSFNHYAYGAVGDWMVSTVAGLQMDPEVPGFRRIVFSPQVGGSLTFAAASLKTRWGRVAIRWSRNADELSVIITVPPGCSAVFIAPPGYPELEETLPPGEHRFHLNASSLPYEPQESCEMLS